AWAEGEVGMGDVEGLDGGRRRMGLFDGAAGEVLTEAEGEFGMNYTDAEGLDGVAGEVLTEGEVGGGDVEGEGWGLVDGVAWGEEEEEVLEVMVEQSGPEQIIAESGPDFSAIESSIAPDPLLCPVATFYTTKADDSGDKIAKQFFPEDDVEVAWAYIVTCNQLLQALYKAVDGDETTIRFDTMEGMDLVIPDKQAFLQQKVVGNLTFEELISMDSLLHSSFEGLTAEEFMSTTGSLLYKLDPSLEGLSAEELMSIVEEVMTNDLELESPSDGFLDSLLPSSNEGDDENSGGNRRKLYTEGSVQSFSPMPGKRPGDWDLYQCVPMFSRDRHSKVTILRYGNNACQAYWDKFHDGCSGPSRNTPFASEFAKACTRHDACYWLSNLYNPNDYPISWMSRQKCDQRFHADMYSACDWDKCSGWDVVLGVCAFCKRTADAWAVIIYSSSVGKSTIDFEHENSSRFRGVGYTSLKQFWRPWDWRMPRDDINYVDGFLSSPGEIASMMNGKKLYGSLSHDSYVYMIDPKSTIYKDANGVWWTTIWNSPGTSQVIETGWGGARCLSLQGNGEPGSRVVSTKYCLGGKRTRWYFDDIQRLHSVWNPDLCLDIAGASDANFADVIVWHCNGGANQQWYIPCKDKSNGLYCT
ncbi:hypothetical protein ACHAXM_001127, partial [Skeletonema potamos]